MWALGGTVDFAADRLPLSPTTSGKSPVLPRNKRISPGPPTQRAAASNPAARRQRMPCSILVTRFPARAARRYVVAPGVSPGKSGLCHFPKPAQRGATKRNRIRHPSLPLFIFPVAAPAWPSTTGHCEPNTPSTSAISSWTAKMFRVSPDAARRFLTIANRGDTGKGRFGEGEMG